MLERTSNRRRRSKPSRRISQAKEQHWDAFLKEINRAAGSAVLFFIKGGKSCQNLRKHHCMIITRNQE